jgi:hypothetical protein
LSGPSLLSSTVLRQFVPVRFDQMNAQEQAFHNGPCPRKEVKVRKEYGTAVDQIVLTWSEIIIVTQFRSLKCSGDLYSHSECALSAFLTQRDKLQQSAETLHGQR